MDSRVEKDDELILLGRLGRAWGLQGELLFRPENDGGLRFHRRFTVVFVEGVVGPQDVEGWREDGSGKLYLQLRGIETPEAAKALSDSPVYVQRAALPETGEGVWYVYQLVGLSVLYEDGAEIGEVVAVEPGAGGADDVVVVRTPRGGERLFPFNMAVVVSLDLKSGRMVLRRMEEEEVHP